MFEEGYSYTRHEISEKVGGGTQDCLSHSGGRVVAICMRKDKNPEAPKVLLVGKGPVKRKYSEILCTAQRNDAIPVFVKKASGGWEFQGNYKVEKASLDQNIIAEYERTSHRDDVQMVVYLAKV